MSTYSTERVVIPRVNYGGKRTRSIDMIVVHVTEGNAASVRSWFGSPRPEAPTSAHWMIEISGNRVLFVPEDEIAYHAGRVDHPTAPLVLERPSVNPNAYSIGIEHEGDGRHPLTPAQLDSSVELLREISDRYEIPLDRRHVVGHHEIYRPKSCPGAIDVGALVANAAAGGPIIGSITPDLVTRPPAPALVWSPFLGDWLLVTSIRSDADWSFVRCKAIRSGTMIVEQRSTESLDKMIRSTRTP